MKKKIMFIYGTRPEAIKMAPLIQEFKNNSNDFEIKVCLTGQHREMLDQVNQFFRVESDYDLSIMSPNQTLFTITSKVLLGIEQILDEFKPDLIFVQGDTTTVFAGALGAYYKQIKVAHLEAGLRSNNKYSPFPEEINRTLTADIADFHFAPTEKAVYNLKSENIVNNVWNVGNTVIDALFLGLDIIKRSGFEDEIINHFNTEIENFEKLFQAAKNNDKRIILVTGHRRESFGKPFEDMCNGILEIVNKHEDVEMIYPVHLNPNVRKTVNEILDNHPRIHLIEPLDYPYLIWLENLSYIILTDSGGIQEEGPSLGKPVLVMRDVTERIEGIEAGTARLVGTNKNKIIDETEKLLTDKLYYENMAKAVNPYGDGHTSKKIIDILKDNSLWK